MDIQAPTVVVNGSEFAGEPGRSLTIGRDPDADLFLDDPLVSRQHANLTCEERGWVFRDAQSTNGSFLAGQRVLELVLSGSATIRLGDAHKGQPLELRVESLALPSVTSVNVTSPNAAAPVVASAAVVPPVAAPPVAAPPVVAQAVAPPAAIAEPATAEQAAPPVVTQRSPFAGTGLALLLISVAAIIAGSALPWFTSSGLSTSAWKISIKFLFVDITATGGPDAGPLLLVSLLALIPVLTKRPLPRIVLLLVATLTGAAPVAALVRTLQVDGGPSLGYGAIVTFAGSVGLAIQALRQSSHR